VSLLFTAYFSYLSTLLKRANTFKRGFEGEAYIHQVFRTSHESMSIPSYCSISKEEMMARVDFLCETAGVSENKMGEVKLLPNPV
jgi:hypothetical protein